MDEECEKELLTPEEPTKSIESKIEEINDVKNAKEPLTTTTENKIDEGSKLFSKNKILNLFKRKPKTPADDTEQLQKDEPKTEEKEEAPKEPGSCNISFHFKLFLPSQIHTIHTCVSANVG
jgi:hypothetical protein